MLTEDDINRIQRLRSQNYSKAKIAKELGISRNTVRKYWNGSVNEDETEPHGTRREPDDLLICLSKWLSALCWAIPLNYADENALMISLRKEISALDSLIVSQLRESEAARRRFFIQFIANSTLGQKYRSERTFAALFAELNLSYRPLPDLKEILKHVLAGKQIKPQGPCFPSLITTKEHDEAELIDDESIPSEDESEE